MVMEDKEIYRGKEDWDLSPEERVTLNRDTESLYGQPEEMPGDEGQIQLQSSKKETLKKKFLSKSMAFFVSAAVVTGVISGAGSGRPSDSSLINKDYTCPVCNTVNCEFWDNRLEMEVFTLSGSDNGQYETDSRDFGVGTLGYDRNYRSSTQGILMPDGRRAMLSDGHVSVIQDLLENNISTDRIGNYYQVYLRETKSAVFPQEDLAVQSAYYGFSILSENNAQISEQYYVLAQLVYSPDGEEPDLWPVGGEHADYLDFIEQLKYAAISKVEGEPCLFLRTYSSYSQENAENALESFKVKIWRAGNTFALGSNLKFTENDRVKLSGENRGTSTSTWRNKEYPCYVHWGVIGSRYSVVKVEGKSEFRYNDIVTEVNSFEDIRIHTEETERLARERGHRVPAVLKKLDHITVNDIGYTLYLLADAPNDEERPNIVLFISPDIDPNIALRKSDAYEVISEDYYSEELKLDNIRKLTSLKETEVYRNCGYSSIEEMLFKEDTALPDMLNCIEMR